MLSDEEKKAIEELTEIKELFEEDLKENYEVTAILDQIDLESLVIALNLIEKQSKLIDLIKAKIEPKLKELDEQINEEWKKYGNSKELQDMEDMYNFLQSLLEKE